MQMDKKIMYFASNFPNHYITINEANLVMNDTCKPKTLIMIKLDISLYYCNSFLWHHFHRA
jgi:hypothetical protein